jgi:hypothetical protein
MLWAVGLTYAVGCGLDICWGARAGWTLGKVSTEGMCRTQSSSVRASTACAVVHTHQLLQWLQQPGGGVRWGAACHLSLSCREHSEPAHQLMHMITLLLLLLLLLLPHCQHYWTSTGLRPSAGALARLCTTTS